ncbi:S41 family peptidase [Polluticaenibacter yanchengensis]|uniref:Tricorn protease homolog n=1 Tax=Polluticaenibacter yanchengensis TaxID=3014562 RepID=A0ABT4UMQ3_9BACT|nr:S41 family peptidase [Chitinophagaceae bacterium LY-5]
MKKLVSSIIVFIMGHQCFAQQTPYFASDPSLSPDAATVYFTYDSDIWKVPVSGGEALRITALSGNEINPRVSPDGKWLAFSSNQYGNYDVFLLSLSGGEIEQLTYHQSNDRVESWSWDSKLIYFTSDRYNNFGSYSVPATGGTAKKLFEHFFNTTNALIETPSGEYIFTNTMESESQVNRKRYKGANNPDLLGYNPKTRVYKQYTNYNGKDINPTVDKNGTIYFISDEKNGEYNLYSLNNGLRAGLTDFKTPIRRPSVSADGSKVVFERDYQLYIYDVKTKLSKKLEYSITFNKSIQKTLAYNTDNSITHFDISPDGKKMAFTSRGALFVSDIKGKFVKKVINTPERIMEVKWLKDNETLLFNQTRNGFQNLYSVRANGSGNLKELTKDAANNRDMNLNKDLSKAVYISGRDEVRLLDIATGQSTTIVKDEIWGFQNSAPSFSPDGRYILFTAFKNFEQDILVYHIADKKVMNLTNTGVTESDPTWSPDGKYIYFTSNRTSPSYPFGMQNASVFCLALDWYSEPFKSDKFDDLFKDDQSKKPDSAAAIVRINPEAVLDRIKPVSNNFGTQYNPVVFSAGGKQFVFYNSTEEKGSPLFYKTVMEEFEKNKTEKVFDKPFDAILKNGDKFFVLAGGNIHTFSPETNKLDKILIAEKFDKNLEDEFKQMYYEVWAGLDENFYNEHFHGINWQAKRDEFARYLPFVNNRNNLKLLLNDLLGELNSSHLGFSSNGKEEATYLQYVTNETGIVFNKNNAYEVDHIARKSPAFNQSVTLQKGDILTKVNGVKVDMNKDRDSYFTTPGLLDEMVLEFTRNNLPLTVKIHPANNASFKDNLYDEWILNNKLRVNANSNNRIAYSHMKNMSTQALESFLLDMVEQENNKEATILDLRYNRGGNVHDKVLNFLAQRPYLQWQYRGGKKSPQSNFAPSGKPIVLLINESSLSDAEMTAAGFKALKLGTIIGTETYRWIIFTSGQSLVDGSFYRIPAWGCYTLDGKNLEFTGVAPDIEVRNTFEDNLKGDDPQLERAIEEILKQLKNK